MDSQLNNNQPKTTSDSRIGSTQSADVAPQMDLSKSQFVPFCHAKAVPGVTPVNIRLRELTEAGVSNERIGAENLLSDASKFCREALTLVSSSLPSSLHRRSVAGADSDLNQRERFDRAILECGAFARQWLCCAVGRTTNSKERQIAILNAARPRQIPENTKDPTNPRNLEIFAHNKLVASSVHMLRLVFILAHELPEQSTPGSQAAILRSFASQDLITPISSSVSNVELLELVLMIQGTRSAFRGGNLSELLDLVRGSSGIVSMQFFETLAKECRDWHLVTTRLMPAGSNGLDLVEASGGTRSSTASDIDTIIERERRRLYEPLSATAAFSLARYIIKSSQQTEPLISLSPFSDAVNDLGFNPKFIFANLEHALSGEFFPGKYSHSIFNQAGSSRLTDRERFEVGLLRLISKGLTASLADLKILQAHYTFDSSVRARIRIPARRICNAVRRQLK